MKRRDFLKEVAVATAVFGSVPNILFAADTTSSQAADKPAKKQLASDRVILGPQKLNVSRLAMGTGTTGYNHGSNQTRKLGVQGLAALLKGGFDAGVTFWDSADQYGSHEHIKEALKSVPREKVTIMTKTHATTEAEMRADLDRFRKELGTDYIDIVLLHCMTDADWNKKKAGAMNVLAEVQKAGAVRCHGVSCHSLGAIRTAVKEDWVQVDLARINPAGAVMDGPPDVVVPILKELKAAGKGVIGMKIFGEGRLRTRQDECLRYVLGLDCVDAFVIGFENKGELDDAVSRIAHISG